MTADRIIRRSLHGELVEQLRDLIVEGKLPEGESIREMVLCERFGVSRTPLREALKVLASEGLVVLAPNRGAIVSKLKAQDVEEIFPVLGLLEGFAGQLACSNATEEQIERIASLQRDMMGRYRQKDLPGYFKLNQMIHDAILEAAGNANLRTVHRILALRVQRARYRANLSPARWAEAIREHEEILNALRKRDGAKLSRLMQQHLKAKAEAVMKSLLSGELSADDGAAKSPSGRTRRQRVSSDAIA
jgi:DNA-binding GntR family transcriptional regulator